MSNFKSIADYFKVPDGYFWKWSERGEVIEWKDGSTVAYRDDLTKILRGVAEQGEPTRLGAVIAVLAACREDWQQERRGLYLFHTLNHFEKELHDAHESSMQVLNEVSLFLNRINDLTLDMRSGDYKIHLLSELFKGQILFEEYSFKAIMDGFASGTFDAKVFHSGISDIPLSRDYFADDMAALYELAKNFPDANSLHTVLKTGLQQLPPPVEIPAIEEPEPLTLLESLAADPKTQGIAQLTQNLLAALHIPMHTHGASDLPLGGVADITNRGNFDKLLLSELAQDDAVLTARLVNNEALYLRRESPPQNNERQRVILIDSTLKMWGMPRPFALSAALALCENRKDVSTIEVHALQGATITPLSISSKKGVFEALNVLDPSLHCGLALERFFKQQTKTDATDYVFISDVEAMNHPNFKAIFNSIKPYLKYVIAVNRAGDLTFSEIINGHSRLISTSKFDLETLLFSEKKAKTEQKKGGETSILSDDEMPAFLYYDDANLLFPLENMQITAKNCHPIEHKTLLVTDTQRVLYWASLTKAAEELLMYIEKGQYCFADDKENDASNIIVFDSENAILILYILNYKTKRVERIDLADKMQNIEKVALYHDRFVFKTLKGKYENALVIGEREVRHYVDTNEQFIDAQIQKSIYSQGRRSLNNGYNILQRFKNIYVDERDYLTLDGHSIVLSKNNEYSNIKLIKETNSARVGSKRFHKDVCEVKTLPSNSKVKFYKVVWEDGSVAMLDSRGFLHLKSSSEELPEITILLVVGKTIACWSSDGFAAGNPYFLKDWAKTISCVDFYTKYILPFVEKLVYQLIV